jgi:hypothetical protein
MVKELRECSLEELNELCQAKVPKNMKAGDVYTLPCGFGCPLFIPNYGCGYRFLRKDVEVKNEENSSNSISSK